MAFSFGFYNSVNGDRVYNADQMSAIFEGLLSNGVYERVGNKLAVQPSSGMVIQVNTGRGWFNKRWVKNDSTYSITLEDSDVTLNRYAAICIRVDDSESARSVSLVAKYSEFETTPTKPTMTRTDAVNEYCLAYIYIGAGVTAITASMIEDTRSNSSLCGWVTGLIDQLDATTLYTQFTALFNEWFEGLQNLVNENTETMLVAALPTSIDLTLTADGWAWNDTAVAFTQDVTVTGMSATKSVIIQPAPDSVTNYSAAEVRCATQGANKLTFTAVSQPTADMVVNALHMGV